MDTAKESTLKRYVKYVWGWVLNPVIVGLFSGAGYCLGMVGARMLLQLYRDHRALKSE